MTVFSGGGFSRLESARYGRAYARALDGATRAEVLDDPELRVSGPYVVETRSAADAYRSLGDGLTPGNAVLMLQAWASGAQVVASASDRELELARQLYRIVLLRYGQRLAGFRELRHRPGAKPARQVFKPDLFTRDAARFVVIVLSLVRRLGADNVERSILQLGIDLGPDASWRPTPEALAESGS